MAQNKFNSSYKFNFTRYRHYYSQLYKYSTKPPIQVSIALLLTIFTILFFSLAAIKPTLTTITKLVKEIEDKEVVLEQLKKKSTALATAQQIYSHNTEAIIKLNRALPEHNNPKEFIKYVESAAAQAGIPLDSISVSEFDIPPMKSEDPVELLPVTINISGNYQELVDLMDKIYLTPRFIAVDSVGITTENTTSSNRSSDLPQMLMKVNLVAVKN